MRSGTTRLLSALLALCLFAGNLAPAAAYAQEVELTEAIVETDVEITEAAVVETAAETTEAAVAETVEETAEATVAETVEETVEETVAETVEETVEATVEETVAETTEETVEETVETTEETMEDLRTEEITSNEDALLAAAEDKEDTVYDYATFLANLKVLEGYASSFASSTGKDANELVLNFIRTGVERYNESLWPQLAGQEITAFTNYVQNQDTVKGTNAMILRNIEMFTLPNGDLTDFGHMFGTLNISYVNVELTADLGGWAGDICDLLNYSYYFGEVPAGTVDEMAAYIKENCFGVDADNAFGMDDFYGDMDAFYLGRMLKEGNKLSTLMEAYFTAELDDEDRSAYFLNKRFKGLETHEDVRNAVYKAYTDNIGLSVLESDRGLTDQAELREACCYAFADYVFEKGGHLLEGDTGEDDEDDEDDEETDEKENWDNPYYSVFSSSSSTIAPGVVRESKYAKTADGKQNVFHVATIDIARDDVSIHANYKDNDPSKGWGMSRVADQMAAAKARHTNPADEKNYVENYVPVLGVNGDFYNMSNGKPSGALVMEGVQYSAGGSANFFAILKDGTPVIGTASEWANYAGQVQEAIGGSVMLVKNGKSVIESTSTYYVSRAPRTCVGITEDGKVVLMVLDGRQEPFSAGGSIEEIAQIMLDAGCVVAMNLDGGGSSTFAVKPEGSDDVRILNSPSDGYARSVSSSLMVVSTAKVSKEFSYASITSEYDYLTIGTQLQMTAVGVSESGSAAEIPENAVWQVSDDTIGTVDEAGIFTASENGTVQVQLAADGEVLGSKTLDVVVPDKIAFEKDSISAIYGVETELPVNASYQGNPVAFNLDDIWVYPYDDYAGYVDGITFVGDEEYGKREVEVWVELNEDYEICDTMIVNLFKADEAVFDFDHVTSGNRTLAWNRDVSNATTIDNVLYQVTDPSQGMDVAYTFALDMKAISIPEKLTDIVYMLPGGDQVDATAWDFLMQLAERVSVLTEVKATVRFDADLDLDVSGLTVVNDYFYQKSVELDEATNTVTITCGWVDQTQAIDPDAANPICIISGIKATPKDNAAWDAKDQVELVNSGEISYDIFLRANALYSFACEAANQEKFGLVPFDNKDVIINGATEKGASFSDIYATFSERYLLDKTNRNGWEAVENHLYYYINNVAIEGGIHLLPGYEDPANKYFYNFNEDGSSLGTVNGLFELEDGLHYAIDGAPQTGWQVIPDDLGNVNYYYFDKKTGAAVDGVQTIDGYTYTFENHILILGQIVKDARGYRYRWAGDWVKTGWTEIAGEIYYAYTHANGYFDTGLSHRWSPDGEFLFYLFAEDGRWMREFSGFYVEGEKTYWVQNGYVSEFAGLVEFEGDYYYISSQNIMVKDRTYWISKTNGLLPEKSYVFDADGKIVLSENEKPSNPGTPETPDVPEEPGEVKNGIVEEDGELYYYVNGVKTYAGLIQIDGAYYYFNSSYKAIRNKAYWITKTNGLLPEKSYNFDADGKIVFPEENPDTPVVPDKPVEPDVPAEPDTPVEVKNGIVEENGGLFYYVNNAKYYAGLIKIGEDYYYVNTSGQVIAGRDYWITKTNGLLPEKSYTFGADGKIILPEDMPEIPENPENPDVPEEPGEVKNGIVEENGELYYYVNGVKTYAGLIQIGEDYYYVNTSCKVVRNRNYWITKTNGLLQEKSYKFDETGKIVFPDTQKNGIVEEDGELYYYVSGVKTYAGLIRIGEDYYYVNTSGKVIRGRNYWISKTNGLLPEKSYAFAEDGKLIMPEGGVEPEQPVDPDAPLDPNAKNGIVEEDGELYYYVNGVKTYAGLIKIGDYYYYVNSNGKVIRNRSYWITKTNGLMKEKSYTFDDQGRMIL